MATLLTAHAGEEELSDIARFGITDEVEQGDRSSW